jgi:hypothetical protein
MDKKDSAAPSRPAARKLLKSALPLDTDLEAFCLDFFPQVHRRFGSGMERLAKENLLLSLIDTAEIVRRLQEWQKE